MTIDRRALLGAGAAGAVLASGSARGAAAVAPRFLWGAATAAHQIEGGNVNADYWVLEHIADTYFREPSGDACDSYHRWRDDLALVGAGGMNAYRFSIEWARIEPERGEISRGALDYYKRLCATARDRGIEPVVTFHHFTSPRWIAAQGGWENPATADAYARYAGIAARALGDTVRWVCTMNEPNAQVTSKVLQLGRPWDREPAIRAQAARAVGSSTWGSYFLGDSFRVRDTCLDAHHKGRDAIKAAMPHARVGLTLALQELSAGPGGDALLARIRQEARAPFYETARADDFIGVQTYNRGVIGPAGYLRSPGALRDAADADASPGALVAVADEAHQATGRPVFVTENGINAPDDALRVRHLRATLDGLASAIDGGLPVLGYMHWSLLDDFEWSSGYVPRFGLVAVDRTSFRRTPKPSLAAYRAKIAELRARHRWA
ncbi:glycoside hydrolase family 1 protein [Sphingomonas sp.]|uniref:glycoside hydrolase family 1 protein n=1 Tax=Sphingomonas sp. TaxID=28214 RepID=UPI003CC5E018